jgi:hypothetical protein
LSSRSKYSQTENRNTITVNTDRFLDPLLCQSKPVKSLTLDFFNIYFNINCHLCPGLPSVGFSICFRLKFFTALISLIHSTCLAYFVVLNSTTLILCGTTLLVGRSRDRFPVVTEDFFRGFRRNHVPWGRRSL